MRPYRKTLDCNQYGAEYDKEIGWDAVDDLSHIHAHLYYEISKAVIAIEIEDKDDFFRDLKCTWDALRMLARTWLRKSCRTS